MADLLIVYVGRASRTNLILGLENGIWGFKNNRYNDFNNLLNLNLQGTYLLLGEVLTGGGRVPEFPPTATANFYLAEITNGFYIDRNVVWPDENDLMPDNRYINRLNFNSNNILRFNNIAINKLPEDISEALRNSGSRQGIGNLKQNIDINIIINSLGINNSNQITLQNPPLTLSMNDINVEETLTTVKNYISSKGFKYEFEEIANFYLSLKAKPFVILAGISGTGKTQLPRQFAAALGLNENIKQVPVRPDWTDGSDLLGYTDLNGNFIPKDLSNLIIEAEKDPDYPYFFILDEMNLARVEHYFSDYLSIIETRTRNGNSIVTDPIIREEILNNAQNSAVFRGKGLPENLYLIGTVNMDETTHAFSRKVLDRANSIEMNEVNLGWDNSQTEKTEALSGIGNDFLKTEYLSAYELSQEDKDSIKTEIELLIQINEILKRADLHFAYRVRDEIAFYLILNKKYNLMTQVRALDFQLVQKILPRIHGSSERIQKILIDLLYLLEKDSKPSENKYNNFEAIYDDFKDKFKYSRSANKILFMLKRFDEDRFTSFWL
jgi:hypothetical protein